MKTPNSLHHPASFRDPTGFVFQKDGIYYRQVNQEYAEDYELLVNSGLYHALIEKKLLIPHTGIDENLTHSAGWYKTLLPEQIPFVSYPYEWSFNQLRDAALHTLKVLDHAIAHDMILKDATPFNIQFYQGRPVFIDTLSFEKYDPSRPWVAYRQFCECFLYPIYLEYYLKSGMQRMLCIFPDGIPATTVASLLPAKSRLSLAVWLHVLLARLVRGPKTSDTPRAGETGSNQQAGFNAQKLRRLIQHLESSITGLKRKPVPASAWGNYYRETILSRRYLDEKERLFRLFINEISFDSALDIGCNDGYFSKILAGKKASIVAVDSDYQCIDSLYLYAKEKNIPNILPLCMDIASPSPAIGFRNTERNSFGERLQQVNLVVALALVHHLVFSRNIPLADVLDCLAELTSGYLIIEFVPLSDLKTQELVAGKDRYHLPYDPAHFEDCLSKHFDMEKKEVIPGTERILYLVKKRN